MADVRTPRPRRPLHPLLFALYPVLFLWGINASAVPWREGLVLCLLAATVALVAQAISTTLMRDRLAGAVLASVIVAIIFGYGRIYDALVGDRIGELAIGRHRFLLVAAAVLVAAAAWRLHRPVRWLAPATGALDVAAIGLLVMAAIPLVRQAAAKGRPASPVLAEPRGAIVEFRERPDIYYIIADGYGASSTLQALYHFSNAPFLQALKDRGFYIADSSHANYASTVLSLMSSLSMDHIPGRRSGSSPAVPRVPDDRRVFESLAAVRYLGRLGYAVVNVKPTFRIGTSDERATEPFQLWLTWNSLSSALVRSSILTGLAARFLEGDVRRRFLGTRDALMAVRTMPGPKFVYVHFLPPHPPFVFTASGEPLPEPSEDWGDRAGYVAQLRFVNTTLLRVVDSLRQASPREPVIILQGDHGPASTGGPWDNPSLELIKERVPILNAYRVPGRDCGFYQRVTPVNSFRILFNCLFNAAFAPLPDSSYFSAYETPYDFRNVTGLVADTTSVRALRSTRTTRP